MSIRRFTLAALPACLAATVVARVALAEAAPTFRPSADADFAQLLSIVSERSADLRADRLSVDLARTDAEQARLLGNPTLDGSWATVPLGETNPAGLASPMTQIPSYGVGLSYTFPLGKRGPRIARSEALAEAASRTLASSARARTLELVRVLGDLAVATMRVEGLRGLVAGGKGTVELARSRFTAGFATPLEVDRLQIELSRFEQQILQNEANAQATLASCAAVVAAPCSPFESSEDARAFLGAWIERASSASGSAEDRDDVRALRAAERAAAADAELARAQRLPDPTVRVGYVYDQFVVSGNQQSSANVSVSLPLPLFDRGQAQLAGASTRSARLRETRELRLASARARVAALRELLARERDRWHEIVTRMLPPARAVVADVERAANARLLPATDVIQARRALDELLVQEAESFAAGFAAAVDLLAEVPEQAGPRERPRDGGTP